MYYVYMHINKTNSKKYIGITNDINKRWRNHGIAYKPYKGKLEDRHFWNAICKYGFDSFEHVIIQEVETFEQACEAEKHFITAYNTNNRKLGYNIALGGNGGKIYIEHPKGMLGKHHGDEKKEKQSILMTELQAEGRMPWKSGHPRGMLGKKHTEEYKKHISEVMTGRIITEEAKIKIGNARRGKTHTEETRKRLSEANKGRNGGAKNNQALRVAYELGGSVKEFGCVKELLGDLQISKTLFYKLVNASEPYEPLGRSINVYRHLKGLRIMYI